MVNDNTTNGHGPTRESQSISFNYTIKTGLAKMLKGGVIMDVVNADQVITLYMTRPVFFGAC